MPGVLPGREEDVMDSSTIGVKKREGVGEKAGRDIGFSDLDLPEVRGVLGKTGSSEAGDPDWLYLATADPAFFLKGV